MKEKLSAIKKKLIDLQDELNAAAEGIELNPRQLSLHTRAGQQLNDAELNISKLWRVIPAAGGRTLPDSEESGNGGE